MLLIGFDNCQTQSILTKLCFCSKIVSFIKTSDCGRVEPGCEWGVKLDFFPFLMYDTEITSYQRSRVQ